MSQGYIYLHDTQCHNQTGHCATSVHHPWSGLLLLYVGGDLPTGERNRVGPEAETHGGAADIRGGGSCVKTPNTGSRPDKSSIWNQPNSTELTSNIFLLNTIDINKCFAVH